MPRRPRPGYTLVELMAVMAALVALGGVLLPTLNGVGRDTRVKAGADLVRERIADARAHAVAGGRSYRLAVSADGAKLRVAPDEQDFNAQVVYSDDDESHPLVAEDAFPPGVTARPIATGEPSVTGAGGWVRVATFLPDGTCREDDPEVEVRQPACHPLRVKIRGLTGSARVGPGPAGGGP